MLGLLKTVLVGETPMLRLNVQFVGLGYLLAEISMLAAKNSKKKKKKKNSVPRAFYTFPFGVATIVFS